MKAWVCTRYGGPEVLAWNELPDPIPGPRDVLVSIRATTVSSGDWRVRSLILPPGFGPLGRLALGFGRPRQPILGTELAGDVIAVGHRVTRFKPGDRVFAYCGAAMGCHAELRCVAEDGALATIPPGFSDAEAAAMSFGGATALDFLRRGRLRAGERLLVNGASGAVGSALVQLGRQLGAEVTAVCSAANADWVHRLGASRVIDYAHEDFAAAGAIYDIIADTAGTAPYARSRQALRPGGRLLAILGGLPDLLRAPWIAATSHHRIIGGPAPARAEDVRILADLAARGEFRPVIDRCYDVAEMPAAHHHVDAGHKRGSVVVTMKAL